MWRNLESAVSEAYEINTTKFENCQTEEFVRLLENFNTVIGGTGTRTYRGRIQYVPTFLRVEALLELDKLASQKNGTTNAHLKHI